MLINLFVGPQVEIHDDKQNQVMARKGVVYEDSVNRDNLISKANNLLLRINKNKLDDNLTTSKDDLVSNPTKQ